MKAIVFDRHFQEKIDLTARALPQRRNETDCLVRISHAALNRRDQWIREGLYPGIKDDVVLGSDGCGEVIEGPVAWTGKQVVINPNIGWGSDLRVQAATYQILGMPTDGTLAEFVVVPSDRLAEKPTHLSAAEATSVPLAGLTAYRACFTKGGIQPNHQVLVTGIGGGVSQFALQFSVASGASVYVTSSSDEKIAAAIQSGATAGFNYTEDQWTKQAQQLGGFDAIIDSAGGTSVNDYMKVIKPGGRIVCYGSTTGAVPIFNMARLFWSQVQVMGSTMGNDAEFDEMLTFVSDHKLVPVLDNIYKKEAFLDAFNRFHASEHIGKIVIDFQ